MDASRRFLANIISLLVGSGITVFAITTIYNDFIKQPNIQINFDSPELSADSSSLYLTSYVRNHGWLPAQNVTIVLQTPVQTNITYINSSLYYTEDRKEVKIDNDGSNKLIIRTPRLVGFGGQVAFTQELTPLPTSESYVLKGIGFVGNLAVLVAYEGGSTITYYDINNGGIRMTEQTAASATYQILITVGLLLAVVSYFIPQIYGHIKSAIRKSYRSRIYFQIIHEVIIVLETFKKDPISTKIFPADVIDYQEINANTRSFFYNYQDYELISEFYERLRKRDNDLSSKRSYSAPAIHNTDCYKQGLEVLRNIQWSNYGILTRITKSRNIVSTLLSIFPGMGHIALLRIRRGVFILLSFVITFVGFAIIAVSYLSIQPILPSIESFSISAYSAVFGVIVVWLVIYAWQIVDLRKYIRFVHKVESYLDSE